MRGQSITPGELASILRAVIEPLTQEIAGLRADSAALRQELAELKGELQIKETGPQRRARLERAAIFLLPEHNGSLRAIARVLDVPTSTLNSWTNFKKSRAEYMALMQADGRDRFARHFEE